MGNIAETVGQFLRLRQRETPPELKPSYTEFPIDAAQGLERERLLAECRLLLVSGEITPDMFNNFTSNMVHLIGGTRYERNGNIGDITDNNSHYIEEPGSGIIISVGRHDWLTQHSKRTLESGSIAMKPKWTLLPKERAQAIIDTTQDLITEEELHYGDGGSYHADKPVPSITPHFFFAPNYQPPSVKLEMLEKPIPLLEQNFDPRFSPRTITNEQLVAICSRTLRAFENQPSLPLQS